MTTGRGKITENFEDDVRNQEPTSKFTNPTSLRHSIFGVRYSRFSSSRICSPFFNHFLHFIRELSFKEHFFSCCWMCEAKRFCMKRVARTNSKTIFNKLFVFIKDGSFHDFITSIKIIVEKRVTNMFHVHPDLVRPSCFENAFHERDIIKSFKNLVMCDRFLPMLTIRIRFELFSVTLMSSHMCVDRSLLL